MRHTDLAGWVIAGVLVAIPASAAGQTALVHVSPLPIDRPAGSMPGGTPRGLKPGQAVVIRLADGRVVRGDIVWSTAGRIAVRVPSGAVVVLDQWTIRTISRAPGSGLLRRTAARSDRKPDWTEPLAAQTLLPPATPRPLPAVLGSSYTSDAFSFGVAALPPLGLMAGLEYRKALTPTVILKTGAVHIESFFGRFGRVHLGAMRKGDATAITGSISGMYGTWLPGVPLVATAGVARKLSDRVSLQATGVFTESHKVGLASLGLVGNRTFGYVGLQAWSVRGRKTDVKPILGLGVRF